LHCDISIGNILLHRPNENKMANGLLVDFDFAKTIKDMDDDALSKSNDAGDASDGGDEAIDEDLPISGEVPTQLIGTKSIGGNDVWTVSGIYAYQHNR
jgi:hypothetical protein